MPTELDLAAERAARRVLGELLASGHPYTALPLVDPDTGLLPPPTVDAIREPLEGALTDIDETLEGVQTTLGTQGTKVGELEQLTSTGRLSPTELSATIGGAVAPALSAFRADFRKRGNGAATALDSGQAINYVGSGTGRDMAVVDGALVPVGERSTGGWAGYATLHAGAGPDFSRLKSSYKMLTGSGATTGVYTIAFVSEAPYVVGQSRLPMHLEIRDRKDWVYKVRETIDGALTTIASGTFAQTLPLNTERTLSAEIIGSTCYLIFPDGSTAQVTHTAIGTLPRRAAFFESFAGANNEERAAITAISADSRTGVLPAPEPSELIRIARSVADSVSGPSVLVVTTAANKDLALTSAYANIAAANDGLDSAGQLAASTIQTVAGATGKIIFEGEFWATTPATGLLRAQVTGAGGTHAKHIAADSPRQGVVAFRIVATGLTPGQSYSWVWKLSDATGATVVRTAPSRDAVLVATPA